MIQQEIKKDLFEEMEDKKFIEQADEVICDIFKASRLWIRDERNGEKTYELLFGLDNEIERKLKFYFKGLYFATLFRKIKEHEGKEEETELKLGGEA